MHVKVGEEGVLAAARRDQAETLLLLTAAVPRGYVRGVKRVTGSLVIGLAAVGLFIYELVRPPSPAPAFPSVPAAAALERGDARDRLLQLAELRQSGALTQAEFEAEKAKLVAET